MKKINVTTGNVKAKTRKLKVNWNPAIGHLFDKSKVVHPERTYITVKDVILYV